VIVGSIGLVLVAVLMLIIGLVRGVEAFYYGSIVASALAALALIVGVRQFPSSRIPEADFDVRPRRDVRAVGAASVPRQPRSRATVTVDGSGDGEAGEAGFIDEASDIADIDQARLAQADGPVPDDEPDEHPATYPDLVAVGKLAAEVRVIDGRPRYHVSSCMHLLGRASRGMPVREAIAIGFTPCGLCDPIGRLLGQA
jgi:hypothetical protein